MNLVIWELAANDYHRYKDGDHPPLQPLEQFTRKILSYDAEPAVIFSNFFIKNKYDDDQMKNCRNFEDEGECIGNKFIILSRNARSFLFKVAVKSITRWNPSPSEVPHQEKSLT